MKCNILCKFAEEKTYMSDIITQDKIQKFSELIGKADRITVVTHTRPDGDAVGSAVASACFIREKYGKDVGIATANTYSATLDFILDDTDRAFYFQHDVSKEKTEEWISGSDLVLCQDFNGFDRTETLCDILRSSRAAKVLIDHHLHPNAEDFDLCFSTPETSSTCELLFRVLMEMPEVGGDTSRIPMHSLRALMAGMTTDTNNFANSVYPGTLLMASQLLAAGVDRNGIIAELYNRYPERRLRMTGYALKDKMTILPEGVAYIILTAAELNSYGIEEGDLEGLVNMPLGIENVRMSILLKEDNGYFRASVRSKAGTSANGFVAACLNGGGHELAAGGRLYFPRDIEDSSLAEEYLKNAVKTYFKAG